MRLLQVHGKMVALFNTICKLKGSMEVLIDFSLILQLEGLQELRQREKLSSFGAPIVISKCSSYLNTQYAQR